MALLYATTKNGKIHINEYNKERDGVALSAMGKELIAKRGQKIIHHFAHKYSGDRDSWMEPKMTEWHLSYQKICKRENVEVIINKNGNIHIADIYINGKVIELQHSPINEITINERENFYENMIWIFDYTNDENKICEHWRGVILFMTIGYAKIKFCTKPPKTHRTTFYDTGNFLYEPFGYDIDDERIVWCKIHDKQRFIDQTFKSIMLENYNYAPKSGIRQNLSTVILNYPVYIFNNDKTDEYNKYGKSTLCIKNGYETRGHFQWDKTLKKWLAPFIKINYKTYKKIIYMF